MKRAYCILGKAGDLVSVLPCFHADFIETGNKPHVIVATKYATILHGLNYVEPVTWSGDWQDVEGALLSAKRHYREIVVPQMHSESYLPKRMYPSFQLDQWHRCGRLRQWGTLPLVMPRHEEKIDGKMILLGDSSESSPFPHVEDLHSTLVKEFPQHRIVRLSTVKLPLLADLLALYDAADLIVTIDTIHMHLTGASKTPVIALATDKPGRWHGTAYHPRMAAHIRYGDYELKKPYLIHVARQCVNKSPTPSVEYVETAKPGYNMSIMRVGDNLWKTYRYHPGASWRTELMLMANSEVPIVPPAKYSNFSIEDGRLFMFKGKPHLSCTVARSRMPGMKADPCIQGYGELQSDGRIVNWIEPQIGRNDWTSQEKNWCFFEQAGKLHVSYSLAPIHKVFELDHKGHIRNEYRSESPKCWYGEPRGGTQMLEHGEHWLKFFHANLVNPKSDAHWNYSLGALVMQSAPPFKILHVSKQPILVGNEMFNQSSHWKPKCVLTYGAVKNQSGYGVGVGLNDSRCAIAHVSASQLNL